METLGERIRKARLLRNMSQGALARSAGVSQSAISSYENGNRQAPKNLVKLAQTLDVDIIWLSTGQGSMQGPDQHSRISVSEPAWPFSTIDPKRFWALETRDRQTVEATVSALIDSLFPSGS